MTKTVMSSEEETPIADLGCGFFLPLAVGESAMIGHTYRAYHVCYVLISGTAAYGLGRWPLHAQLDVPIRVHTDNQIRDM